jgi:hypothetical protein
MNEQFFLELSERKFEAIEAAELWAANDEFFDADYLPDEPEWREDAELEN